MTAVRGRCGATDMESLEKLPESVQARRKKKNKMVNVDIRGNKESYMSILRTSIATTA